MHPGYHEPQIRNKELIPLASSYIVDCEDVSSVEDFIDFVIKDGNSRCRRSNVKAWRKDALKALRLVNAREMIAASNYVIEDSSSSQATSFLSDQNLTGMDDMDTAEGTPFDTTHDESSATLLSAARRSKRQKLSTPGGDKSMDFAPPETANSTIRVPSVKIEDYANTFPASVIKQARLFFKCFMNITLELDVWPTMLINGPPFCGKSLLVEALAGSLKANFLSVSVGVQPPNMRTWRDVFTQAKNSAPCVLHLDDTESMEKHSVPVGSFRLTCFLKSQLLKELINSGVVVVGETRSLFASLPQSILDLFTQKITFGMMEETARFNLLSMHLCPERQVHLKDLSLRDLAKKTPGYEAGDLLRLVAQLKMTALFNEEESGNQAEMEELALITPAILESALAVVIPAVKNTSEFVTIPDVTWDDVGGLEATKQELYNRFMLLVDDWDRAQRLGRKSNGVLLEGPPGCGKTLIAKALSNCAGLNFLSVKGPEVLNKYQGESERRIREIFERARACQPCLVFFDEIDAICPTRDGDEASGSRISLVNQLLVELDGVDKHRSARVFVVGATNRKDMIDAAILRPGRLGLHLQIHAPRDSADRLAVLMANTKSATKPFIEGGVDLLQEISRDSRTDGLSGAELENVLDLAKQNAHIARRDYVNRDDLLAALNEISRTATSHHNGKKSLLE